MISGSGACALNGIAVNCAKSVPIQGNCKVDVHGVEKLTDRQKDCLRLVGQGFTSKEIGRALALSPSTVDNHINSAVSLLKAPNRGNAARALAAFEIGQNLPRQPAGLAPDTPSQDQEAGPEAEGGALIGKAILTLPPVGGQRNDLDRTTRSLRILQVAVVAAAVTIALTILVAGLFRTFG